MFNIFSKQMGTGAINDMRAAGEQQKDYKFEEVVARVNPVEWVEKPQDKWRKFPIFNQNGSGSCVAQTAAKLLGVSYWLKNKEYVHFSATDIYQQRINRPDGGMGATDVFGIIRKNGATLEELAPSQSMTDTQMDSVVIPDYKRQVGAIFKVSNYLALPIGNIDTVASVIQTTNKAVMVWFFFNIDEWTSVPVLKDAALTNASAKALRHSITAVDFTMYKGKKALIVEDSWGSRYGLAGQRVITEDFFKARNFYAAYLMNFDFDAGQLPNKPHYKFTRQLEFSPTFVKDPDVKCLQDVLKYEGFFPQNTDSSGYYGAITAKAVLGFQKKYQVASTAELDALQGKIVGPATLAKLNELFG